MSTRIKSVSANTDYSLTIQLYRGHTIVYSMAAHLRSARFLPLNNHAVFMGAGLLDDTIFWSPAHLNIALELGFDEILDNLSIY